MRPLRPLALLFKALLYSRHLNVVFLQGISSYCITIMVRGGRKGE